MSSKPNQCAFLVKLIIMQSSVSLLECQAVWTWLSGDKVADRISSPDFPGGRSGASVASSNKTAWIFGGAGFSDLGSGKSHLLNDIWSFDMTNKKFRLQEPGSWTNHPRGDSSSTPALRQNSALCSYSGKLYVYGGFGSNGAALKDLWVFDISSQSWAEQNLTSSSSPAPSARGDCTVWCYGPSMYLFGGSVNETTVYDEMWMLNLSTLEWVKLQPRKEMDNSGCLSWPTGRRGAVSWISGGLLYMFGGSTHPSFSYNLHHSSGMISDLWRFNPQSNAWCCIVSHNESSETHDCTHFPSSRVGSATWSDSNGDLWLFGGAAVSNQLSSSSPQPLSLLSDVWRYEFDRQCWISIRDFNVMNTNGKYGFRGQTTETSLPGSRTEMMSWQGEGNVVFIFGGLGIDEMYFGGSLNDLWQLDYTAVITREYMVSPLLMLSFFGSMIFLIMVGMLIVVICRPQRFHQRSSRLQFQLYPEYYRLENDVI